MGLLCGVGRPAKLALHRRGQNRGGRKLGGLRRAPRWLAVPARERHSELPRRDFVCSAKTGLGLAVILLPLLPVVVAGLSQHAQLSASV